MRANVPITCLAAARAEERLSITTHLFSPARRALPPMVNGGCYFAGQPDYAAMTQRTPLGVFDAAEPRASLRVHAVSALPEAARKVLVSFVGRV